MSELSVVWRGAREFGEALGRIEEKMLAATRAATGEAAEFIRAEAAANADAMGGAGTLGASVKVEGPTLLGRAWQARVGPTADYGRRIEIGQHGGGAGSGRGHNYTAPHPFLKPVIEHAPSQIVDIYRAAWARAYRP